MKIVLIVCVVVILGYGVWKNHRAAKGVGVVDGNLTPCGSRPNCVSSEGPKTHLVQPLPYLGSHSFSLILEHLNKHYKTEVLEQNSNYLHVVISTNTFRFKDDLEFLLKPEQGLIEMRSASRLGYSDLGVNRKRLEKLRLYLEASQRLQH